jgi:hypothetical protein
MVSIVGIESKVNKRTQEEFVMVILQGEIEVKKSKSTSKFYLGAKQVKLPTTLTAEQASELVGTSLAGDIEKVDCQEYEITMPGSNKKVKINHTFQFAPSTSEELAK